MNELISVVVPIYNVEKYLVKCIKSILRQTYTNIEVLLVNDGSTDSCPRICDDFAIKDSRVRVIHKKNGGLSDARNVGIDMAKGEYIAFIDSDDFISDDMLEFLYNRACTDKSDIAACSHRFFYEDGSQGKLLLSSENRILDTTDALRDILYQRGLSMHAWSKLYRTSLFNNIRFPEGKLYEDIGTTYKLLAEATRVSVSTDQKYFYLRRKGSITGSSFNKRMLDSLDFAEEVHKYVATHFPQAIKPSECYLFSTAVSMLDLISQQPLTHLSEARRCKQVAEKYASRIMKDPNVRLKDKLYSWAIILNLLGLALRTKNLMKKIVNITRR